MNGGAHWKIASLSYAIIATVPILTALPIFNNSVLHIAKGVSLVELSVAAIAGMAVDADTEHSKISHMNPALNAVNGVIGFIENIIKFIIKVIIGLGLGLLIFKYSKPIINNISSIKSIKQYATLITYSLAAIFIFAGVANERILKKIPVVGFIYKQISISINKITNILKRLCYFFIYAGSGAFLIMYNFNHLNDKNLYIIAVLLIAIAIFPHRSFLHSIEGIIVFTISISYLLEKIGLGSLKGAFVIGYTSHIYWADIFTKEGVPLLSTPRLIVKALKKLGFHGKYLKVLDRISNFNLKLPPFISTGSVSGNLFEAVYVLVLLAIAIISYKTYGGQIRII